MTFSIEVTRPDDLLRLRIAARNVRLDRREDGPPALVVDDAAQPAFLSVVFPPQTIAERAYFEATVQTAGEDIPPGVPSPPPTPIGPVDVPGQVPARMAHASRLVFRIPAQARIPLTIEGLLDWSALELSVNGIAAIGPDPTPAEIAQAPAIKPPAETETALELPYNLVISPTAEVRWGHRLAPFTSCGRTELWHTRLQLAGPEGAAELSADAPASLRAIWSDNYNAVKRPGPDVPDPDLGLAAMTPDDRHQIVVLTSAFHGYEGEVTLRLGGFGLEGGLRGALAAEAVAFAAVPITLTRPYVPQPFYADQLMLSALGGWLRSRGQWTPPRKAKRRFVFEAPKLEDLFVRLAQPPIQPGPHGAVEAGGFFSPSPAALAGLGLLVPQAEDEQLDLSEWVHVATQGRDHYVRIVYEGELLPFRNRAALVKVTERKFREQNGLVVAHLFQRNFIVVREPEKLFAATDRGMPLKRVRLTTLVTPDIAPPKPVAPGTRSFWVEVMTSPVPTDRALFKFHAVGTDVGGTHVDFTIPMMFVSIADTGTKRTDAVKAYNESGSSSAIAARGAAVPGDKMLFAERAAGVPTDNSQLATRGLNFVMLGLDGSGPRLLKAEVDIPQVQELLGSTAPTTIRLYPPFVDQGFDAATGVFAEIAKEDVGAYTAANPFAAMAASTLGVTFTSDQAGGFATPNLAVSTLSRGLGPLAGQAADAVTGHFDPATFFKAGMAQLFGTFDLSKLLPGGSLGTSAPKLQTSSKDIPGGKLLVATLDWEPPVDNLDLTIAAFKKDHGGTTHLVVHGRIEKPLMFDPTAAPTSPPTSAFTGTLNDFQVTILKMVSINFKSFGFSSQSGSKADVKVDLDPATPLEFDGDLKFVEELRKIIPPDLFGDGPSLDISPTGIRAGFSFGLPPVAVGVFALKDVTLGAALTLPFLDGRPTLDFNVSERPHPFLLAVGIFGGGGFFRLQLDTAGLRVVEAAFEFGATASIDLGVASGGVHIMAGIYFKLEQKEGTTDLAPTLSGYLRMGGYLSVLGLIKVSLEFNLSFTYDGGRDKAYGRATLTVKVEIVFFSTSVEVTVEKSFGGSGGDPTFAQLFAAPDVWSEYALAFD